MLKRFRIVGLCLVAVFALSAVAASSAFGASEFKTKEFPVEFTGKGGKATFETEKGNIVTCENSASKGKVTGKFAAEATITYSGNCKLKAVSPLKIEEECPTIETKPLAVEPVEKLNGGTKTGLDFKGKTSTTIAEFTCTGKEKVKIKVTGSVICASEPIGAPSKIGKVICKGAKGVQEFTTATNSEGKAFEDSLKAESTKGIFKVEEKDAQTTTEELEYLKGAEVEQTA